MSKKRPGHEASMHLVALDDAASWKKVEEHCREVIDEIPNLARYEADLAAFGSNKEQFTKPELDLIVQWKHTCGKNRIYNVKYLNANISESVQTHSRSAIEIARKINPKKCFEADGSLSQEGRKAVQDAIGELGKLKGVGPATASAVMTLVRPDVFCYLYDEVIDCFEPQRDYKISNYLRVNNRCLQIAKTLGTGWTPNRVAKTIWTAARFLAQNGVDLSQYDRKTKKRRAKSGEDDEGEDEEDLEEDEDDLEDDEEDQEDEEDQDEDEDDQEEDEEEAEYAEDESERAESERGPPKKRPRA